MGRSRSGSLPQRRVQDRIATCWSSSERKVGEEAVRSSYRVSPPAYYLSLSSFDLCLRSSTAIWKQFKTFERRSTRLNFESKLPRRRSEKSCSIRLWTIYTGKPSSLLLSLASMLTYLWCTDTQLWSFFPISCSTKQHSSTMMIVTMKRKVKKGTIHLDIHPSKSTSLRDPRSSVFWVGERWIRIRSSLLNSR